MSGVKITINNAAVAAFLRGPEVGALVSQTADTLQRRCGAGFTTSVTNVSRVRAYLRAESAAAKARQARDHTIETAIGQGL